MYGRSGRYWLACPYKNTYPKKKLFTENQLARFGNIVLVGDSFACDEKILNEHFDVHLFPENLEDLKNILTADTSKPVFLYLRKLAAYKSGVAKVYLAGRSYEYFIKAVRLVQYIKNASLITLPVSKELIMEAGHVFYGHTELLEDFFSVKTMMCMYGSDLSIIPLTNHIPLRDVPQKIQHIDSTALHRAILFLRNLTGFDKKIAITGLNPHAGENGKIGDEEKYIKNIVHELTGKGLSIEGPLPADGIFMPGNRIKYSLIITTYHDQALIPFKALYGTNGLNITLNLPILRVSPDHGPAYEFAGKDEADIQSVYKSLKFSLETGEKWIKLYSSL